MRRPTLTLAVVLILSGCDDGPTVVPEGLLGTWILESVNGEQLPWQNQSGTSKVRSGSVTFYADFRYERVRTIEGFWVLDTQTEKGSFGVDGERIKMTPDETGLYYRGSVNRRRVTLDAGPRSAFPDGAPSYRYER